MGDASGRLWEVMSCALLQYAAKHPNPILDMYLAQYTCSIDKRLATMMNVSKRKTLCRRGVF